MRREGESAEAILDGIRAARAAAVARAISWIERGDPRAEEVLAGLPDRAAHVVGITGSPGAGKSTLVNALVRAYRAQGVAVGVLAVDPSSPLTGGALLGDRIRLEDVAGDNGVFFRSLASRGASGGLSTATLASVAVISAAGFGVVLVETVGAGQAEVEIMRVADTVALVLHPGAGDDIQADKAGLMEIADIFVLNKADMAGSDELGRVVHRALPSADRGWSPPALPSVATRGTGVEAIVEAVAAHAAHLGAGEGARRRGARIRNEVVVAARKEVEQALAQVAGPFLDDVVAGRVDVRAATDRLVAALAERVLAERMPVP